MFPLVQPQGAVIRAKTVHMPQKEKWAFIVPEKMVVIEEKLQKGWDVAYVEGSMNEEGGAELCGLWCMVWTRGYTQRASSAISA